MSAYKDTKRGTWYCQFRYTDYQGRTNRTTKLGFCTKKEAVKYEQDFRARAGKSNRVTMGALCDAYLEEPVHTWLSARLSRITSAPPSLTGLLPKSAKPISAIGKINLCRLKRPMRKNMRPVPCIR